MLDTINTALLMAYVKGLDAMRREDGQTNLEYIMLAVLVVAIGAIGAKVAGGQIKDAFTNMVSNVTDGV